MRCKPCLTSLTFGTSGLWRLALYGGLTTKHIIRSYWKRNMSTYIYEVNFESIRDTGVLCIQILALPMFHCKIFPSFQTDVWSTWCFSEVSKVRAARGNARNHWKVVGRLGNVGPQLIRLLTEKHGIQPIPIQTSWNSFLHIMQSNNWKRYLKVTGGSYKVDKSSLWTVDKMN